jgi:hypothetical protein
VTPLSEITYKMDLGDVDWARMKTTLSGDVFDNGRTPEQLRESFEHSYAAVIAYDGGHKEHPTGMSKVVVAWLRNEP